MVNLPAENHIVNSLSKEMFYYMNHLPEIDDFFCTDPITQNFGFLSNDRSNRTSLIDYIPFEQTKFCRDAYNYFGFIDAAVFKFTPNTMLEWHIDDKRRCALNFLLHDADNCFSFIRENVDRWNYNMMEIKYIPKKPVLIDTTNEHTHLNYNSTKTRYLLSVSFGNQPDKASYQEVKQWLLNYKTNQY